MEGNQSIEEYLENHRGRPTGDTPVGYQSSNISSKALTDLYALQLRGYELKDKITRNELIDKIIEKAKASGKEVDEEALRNELNSKSIEELEKALERLENQQSKQEPSTNQQETKTTNEGREPGE